MHAKISDIPYATPGASESETRVVDSPNQNPDSLTEPPGLGCLLLWCFGPSLVAVTLMLLVGNLSFLAFVYAPLVWFIAEGRWVALLMGGSELWVEASLGMVCLQCVLLSLVASRRSQAGFSAGVFWGLFKAAWLVYS